MRDSISLERANKLHPAIRLQVIDLINYLELNFFPKTVQIRIVQSLRTIEEQNDLYAQGRTKAGSIVTKAKGGSSFHNYGLAFDFALMYDKDGNGTYECLSWDTKLDFDRDAQADWMEVVRLFKDKGFTWGGDFKSIQDDPHLEKPFGYDWRELFAKYNNKDFIPNTQYLNL